MKVNYANTIIYKLVLTSENIIALISVAVALLGIVTPILCGVIAYNFIRLGSLSEKVVKLETSTSGYFEDFKEVKNDVKRLVRHMIKLDISHIDEGQTDFANHLN